MKAWVHDALSATPAERDALDRALRHGRRPRSVAPWGLAAIGVALAGWLLWPPAAPPALEAGPWALEAPVALGPSVVIDGLATLSVEQVSPPVVALSQGSARFVVDPTGSDRDLRVRAGEVEVAVTGTVFTVHRVGDAVAVDVERGAVDIRDDGHSRSLTAGGSWRSAADAVVAVVPTADLPPPGPTAAPTPPDHTPPHVEHASPAPAAPPSAAVRWAAILDDHDAGGAPGPLLTAVDAFLDDVPAGPLADEARALRVELLLEAGRDRAALGAVSTLLDAQPAHPRAQALRRLRADLTRDLDGCDAARPLYRAALDADPDDDDARVGLARCAKDPAP